MGVVLVAHDGIRITLGIQPLGYFGRTEETDIEQLDRLVGHDPVLGSVQKKLRGRSIGIFHLAMCGINRSGK